MSNKILVTYASRAGSTAVVAGSAIRGSKWLPEAMQFIQTHRSVLVQKPFAMLTVCITMAMKNANNYRTGVAGWVAPVRAIVQPLDEGFFAGRLDFKKLPLNWDTLMLRLTVALGIFPRGDHRDRNAIHNWTMGLSSTLKV
jgi:menaquinone-dependent protoporphyrinogen oxidase